MSRKPGSGVPDSVGEDNADSSRHKNQGDQIDSLTTDRSEERSGAWTRRMLLQLSGILGSTSVAGVVSSGATASQEETDRDGETREGSTITTEQFSENITTAMSTEKFGNIISNSSFSGVTEQVQVNTQAAQGFPRQSDRYVVLSSGDAAQATGDPETFTNVNWEEGTHFTDYSPDGYDAFDVGDIEIDFEVPDEAQGIAFDYKFGTEENPAFLDTEFQDFFEVQLFMPNGFENIALIDGDPVTVDNAATVSNQPSGDSQDPGPPLPTPQNTAYNAVTELQEVSHDISDFQGEELTLRFRIADASDSIYDSGVFIDNLRFTNDVETDPEPLKTALGEFEAAYEQLQESYYKGEAYFTAILYKELGDEFADLVTTYWGHKAGEVPKDDVDDAVWSTFDSIVEEKNKEGDAVITDETAQALYEFYVELFDTLSQSASLDQLKGTAHDHYIGVGEGQTAKLLFDDGDTIHEILSQNWGLVEEMVSLFEEHYDPGAQEYQLVADVFETKADDLRSRADDVIERKEQQAEKLAAVESDGTLEVQRDTYEKGASAVQPEAAVTIVVVITISKAAVTMKAAEVLSSELTKCAGAYGLDLVDNQRGSQSGVEISDIDISAPQEKLLNYASTGQNLFTTAETYGEIGLNQVTGDQAEEEAVASSFVTGVKKGAKDGLKDLAWSSILLAMETAIASQAEAELTAQEVPDVTEERKLGLLDSIGAAIVNALQFLSPWHSIDKNKTSIGQAEGAVLLENTGSVEWKPKFSAEHHVFDGSTPVASGNPVSIQPKGSGGSMAPGETREYTVEYQNAVEAGFLTGTLQVDIGCSPVVDIPNPIDADWSDVLLEVGNPIGICEMDYYAHQKDSVSSSYAITEEATNTTLADELIVEGETKTHEYTVSGDSRSTMVQLTYGGEDHYLDLHLYDGDDNHVGYDYETNTVEEEIPGATYSGRDTGEKDREWITVSGELESQYTVEVVAPEVGTVIQGVQPEALELSYEVTSSEAPELQPKLSTSSDISVGEGERSTEQTFAVSLGETNGDNPVGEVTVSASPLEHEGGVTDIEPGDISFEQNNFVVEASESTKVKANVTVPDQAAEGSYSGHVEVSTANAGTEEIPIAFEVVVPVAEFADEDGSIPNQGLRECVDQWRTGLVNTDTLRETVDAWRQQEEVS